MKEMVCLLIFFFLISICLIIFLVRRRSFAVVGIGSFYTLVACYSLCGLIAYDFAAPVPWGFDRFVDDCLILKAVFIYILLAISLMLGATVVCFKGTCSIVNLRFSNIRLKLYCFLIKYRIVVVALSFFAPCMLMVAYGPSQLLSRESYDIDGWQLGVLLSRVLLPISSFSVALITPRFVRWGMFFVLYVSFFSITSRIIILIPFFYYIGMFFLTGKHSLLRFLVCILLVVIGSSMALDYRLNDVQGLFPNIYNLLSGQMSIESIVNGMNYVFSYSVVYLAYMIKTVDYNPEIFWVGINPLPSFIIDIQLVIEKARVAPRIPFSAVGELYLFMGNLVFLFMFFAGVFLTTMERVLFKKCFLLALFFVVFIVVIGLMSTQYNLRGSARLFYYSVIIFLAGVGYSNIVALVRNDGHKS